MKAVEQLDMTGFGTARALRDQDAHVFAIVVTRHHRSRVTDRTTGVADRPGECPHRL